MSPRYHSALLTDTIAICLCDRGGDILKETRLVRYFDCFDVSDLFYSNPPNFKRHFVTCDEYQISLKNNELREICKELYRMIDLGFKSIC